MSNYPSGLQSYYHSSTDYYCSACDCFWVANTTVDLGQAALDDEQDAICTECGKEGENR